ncbi:MAG: bifunctional demethylmenaquinone methyltransferase/2-methoxy-6-polyprenyl-1,4-benzoquinol methylase UbiE [Ignavibacteriaceae bacterium]|nr:bifunctional demethylmenaquinone methyltransferase/2-methoxy-6-polyprenyl-1,4-benzoquinol methylase UbiE [Ignavibacteria bacterium]MBT8391474.1 bifunctional demethylmenaquinone methyltransferase/2-methoxy-6-polyprenyl-1,4-benzoquinol methylase UbiE [Ignavibacteria bacterium]NNJ54137.1 bifunctional demethylmenaquinone methyltransferase/2-methoxy-6-polyprenyl-1,4-benzoquinol methylase UbiE [Ignavibacteriaceae bacterium]NNL21404.1 bifunctional demethylmenaquinone methyltransferase/2-methoxy-6-po
MNEKKNKVKNIFDSIAFKYDFLNHLLSFGFDKYWRRKALKLTGLTSDSILLDVACGTGDVAIEAKKQGASKIVGADLSHNMLQLFKDKSDWIDGSVVQTVAENMPFKYETFSNITVAFGVRNFYNIEEGFASFYNLLKHGGKATIIEFQLPKNKIFKRLYRFYFNKILPIVGGLFSKNKTAYTYLPQSVKEFDEQIVISRLLKEVGFSKIESYSLTFGIVQVLIAVKSSFNLKV